MNNIRVLISEEEVDKKIREMAAEISKAYEGKELHISLCANWQKELLCL